MRLRIVVILFALSVFIPRTATIADTFKDVYKALIKIEMQLESGTDIKSFRDSLADAKTEMEFLSDESKNNKSIEHLKKTLFAFEIVNEIWQTQLRDYFLNPGVACIPEGTYESWLKSFPQLLNCKWGVMRVGPTKGGRIDSAGSGCKLILKDALSDFWRPCLAKEAKKEMDLAKKSYIKTTPKPVE